MAHQITLRNLVKMDTAIGAVTADDCLFIATVLEKCGTSKLMRLFLPKELRKKDLDMRMLAATLGRTPAERVSNIQEEIRLAMAREERA